MPCRTSVTVISGWAHGCSVMTPAECLAQAVEFLRPARLVRKTRTDR